MAAMSFKKKALWLILVGGFSVPGDMGLFLFYETVFKNNPLFSDDFNFFMMIFSVLFWWLFGSLITAVCGIPVLFLIDRYFGRFTLRYVIGGSVAGCFVFPDFNGPLFNPRHWFNPSQLNPYYPVHFLFWGLFTGIVFTIVVRLDERRQRRLAIETTL